MADHPTSVEPAPPPPPQLLLALLEASAISAIVHPNRLGGPKIREDASFDQLSLLSVRQPDAFAALMDAASEGDDPVTRRVPTSTPGCSSNPLVTPTAGATCVGRFGTPVVRKSLEPGSSTRPKSSVSPRRSSGGWSRPARPACPLSTPKPPR